MTRRITALLLALLLALSLTACGNPAQTVDTIEKTAQTVQQIAEVLNDTEVVYDPRKINYKSNQELKAALVALLLSRALTDPSRRRIENKEYFAENVTVYMQGEQTKVLGFGELPPYQVQESLYPEIINDWMIYRDHAGLG